MHIEALSNYRLAYIRRVGPYGSTNIQAMETLKNWAKEKNLLTSSAVIFGIAQDNPETTPPEDCRYDVCIVISKDYPLNNSLEEGKLAGGTYAIFKVEHTAEAIQKAWAAIFPSIKNSGYKMDNKPILERYNVQMVEAGYCELCVPVFS